MYKTHITLATVKQCITHSLTSISYLKTAQPLQIVVINFFLMKTL